MQSVKAPNRKQDAHCPKKRKPGGLDSARWPEIEDYRPEAVEAMEQGRDNKAEVEYYPTHAALKPLRYKAEIEKAGGGHSRVSEIENPMQYVNMGEQKDSQKQTCQPLEEPEQRSSSCYGLTHLKPPDLKNPPGLSINSIDFPQILFVFIAIYYQ
jgi:hypothetical protein